MRQQTKTETQPIHNNTFRYYSTTEKRREKRTESRRESRM